MNNRWKWAMGGAAGLGALTAGLGYVYRKRRQIIGRLLRFPPVRHKVQRETVIITMRDGVNLKATHLYPADEGSYPTVLIRTPYGRGSDRQGGYVTRFIPDSFAERGYHVLIQDVRGTFGSAGEFEPFVHEIEDGADTLEWLTQQPWFNGMMGLWGPSYLGYTQWAAMTTQHPAIKAVMPIMTQSDMGPAAHPTLPLDLILRWMLILAAMADRQLPQWERLRRIGNAKYQDQLLRPIWEHLPMNEAETSFFRQNLPFFDRWLTHFDPDSEYWRKISVADTIHQHPVPVHLVGGWYDIFLDGLLRDYEKLVAHGRPPHLTIGKWHHLDFTGMTSSIRLGLEWFDQHLKGDWRQRATYPVNLWVMGRNEWRGFEQWPPASRPTTYYLHPAGELSAQLPASNQPPSRYQYDPLNPTPNLGGPLISTSAGAVDNRVLESRPDVLTFTTRPLEQELELIGFLKVVLYVTSSRPHTDFFVRLCDVNRKGVSYNICDGLCSVKPGTVEPLADGIWRLEITLSATAHSFQPGHRVRVQVSSGAHPRLVRNLGTGLSAVSSTQAHPAEQTIFHTAEYPSAIILPVTNG